MPRRSRLPVATRFSSDAERLRVLGEVRFGKIDCTGDVTLLATTTSTVLRDALFGRDTVLVLVPTDAAGAALAVWQAANAVGSVTLGHAAPVADTTFLWVALG